MHWFGHEQHLWRGRCYQFESQDLDVEHPNSSKCLGYYSWPSQCARHRKQRRVGNYGEEQACARCILHEPRNGKTSSKRVQIEQSHILFVGFLCVLFCSAIPVCNHKEKRWPRQQKWHCISVRLPTFFGEPSRRAACVQHSPFLLQLVFLLKVASCLSGRRLFNVYANHNGWVFV